MVFQLYITIQAISYTVRRQVFSNDCQNGGYILLLGIYIALFPGSPPTWWQWRRGEPGTLSHV